MNKVIDILIVSNYDKFKCTLINADLHVVWDEMLV